MLRRKPTAITLTSEDVAAYEDNKARAAADGSAGASQNEKQRVGAGASGAVDPNDELKPLPGEKARIVRSRDERIGIGSRS